MHLISKRSEERTRTTVSDTFDRVIFSISFEFLIMQSASDVISSLFWFKEPAEQKEDEELVLEQFVQSVDDFSSQYGSEISVSYTAFNLRGPPSNFPDYGDYPQAFVMVSKNHKAMKCLPNCSPQFSKIERYCIYFSPNNNTRNKKIKNIQNKCVG